MWQQTVKYSSRVPGLLTLPRTTPRHPQSSTMYAVRCTEYIRPGAIESRETVSCFVALVTILPQPHDSRRSHDQGRLDLLFCLQPPFCPIRGIPAHKALARIHRIRYPVACSSLVRLPAHNLSQSPPRSGVTGDVCLT